MRKLLLLSATVILLGACYQNLPGNMVYIKGGTFKNKNSNYYEKDVRISNFYLSKYEVTQKEWIEVMNNNPSLFKGDDLPVDSVSWYDSIEYCNLRSKKEGLTPYYAISKNEQDPFNDNENDELKWLITINIEANGYRLPTEAEWEYAAGGGKKSKGFIYSGSDNADEVAWYWRNSGEKILTGKWHWQKIENNNYSTKPVGSMKPNELGLYDMSGNTREWTWDWYSDFLENNSANPMGTNRGVVRVQRGGGIIGGEQSCETSYRSSFEPDAKAYDQGLRVCRSK